MIIADLPPVEQERIVCSISAAVSYDIPADIMLAIAEIEGGSPDLKVQTESSNSYDAGYMQFNNRYLSEISKRYSYNYEDMALSDGCYAFFLAAWRVAGHIKQDKGSIWQKAANYHSRTPKYNLIYQRKLISKANKWAVWLKKNFSIKKEISND
jgi:hypothetical protein